MDAPWWLCPSAALTSFQSSLGCVSTHQHQTGLRWFRTRGSDPKAIPKRSCLLLPPPLSLGTGDAGEEHPPSEGFLGSGSPPEPVPGEPASPWQPIVMSWAEMMGQGCQRWAGSRYRVQPWGPGRPGQVALSTLPPKNQRESDFLFFFPLLPQGSPSLLN